MNGVRLSVNTAPPRPVRPSPLLKMS
jgi:hypothetical protein